MSLAGAPFPGVVLPTPAALRLLARMTARVKPPFGLVRWDEAARDVALLLDRPTEGSPTLETIAAQIPAPSTLPEEAMIVILGDVAPPGGLVGRLLGGRVRASRALRGSALLAAGYVRLGGAIDPASGADLTWGYRE